MAAKNAGEFEVGVSVGSYPGFLLEGRQPPCLGKASFFNLMEVGVSVASYPRSPGIRFCCPVGPTAL